MARTIPLWRRLLYAFVPLLLLLAGVEAVCGVLARSLDRSLPPAALKTSPLPQRAVLEGSPEALYVVCVGDSWTYGFGVAEQEAYPAQLQQRLGEERVVVNLGNPGASPIRAARALTSYLYRAPADVIVYLAGSNTPLNTITLQDRQRPAPLRAMRPLLRHLALYRILSQGMARGRVLSDPYLQDWRQDEDKERLSVDEATWLESALESTRANMARMADLAETHGAELLVLTYGLPRELADTPVGEDYRFPLLNETIRQAAAANGLPLVDMEARYQAADLGAEALLYGTERLTPGTLDLHPNALGYALYAEAVADWIGTDRRPLLPADPTARQIQPQLVPIVPRSRSVRTPSGPGKAARSPTPLPSTTP